MAEIHFATADLPAELTRKLWRELVDAFPQVQSRIVSIGAGFRGPSGTLYVAGVLLLTTNPEPDPDEAAIHALVTGHDGTEDPSPFGVRVPLVPTPADLPAQPPDWPDDAALLAATITPPALYAYALGQWRPL